MGYFQRGGKAEVKDILLASWLAFKMVKHAYNYGDSGYFSCFNIGNEPTVLPLDDNIGSDDTNDINVPKEIIELALALR